MAWFAGIKTAIWTLLADIVQTSHAWDVLIRIIQGVFQIEVNVVVFCHVMQNQDFIIFASDLKYTLSFEIVWSPLLRSVVASKVIDHELSQS